MANSKWKKALLSARSNRHKDQEPAARNLVPKSGTGSYWAPPSQYDRTSHRKNGAITLTDLEQASELPAPSTAVSLTPSVPARVATQDDVDTRLISALLETTTEGEIDPVTQISKNNGQRNPMGRSHTLGAVSSSSTSGISSTSSVSRASGLPFFTIPARSAARNLRDSPVDTSKASPSKNSTGLVRPMPDSRSPTSHVMSKKLHRIPQSSSGILPDVTGHYKGGSPIRRARHDSHKIRPSATQVLTNSDLARSPLCPANIAGPSKVTRSRTRNAFNKFTEVLTDHFGSVKGSRKSLKTNDVTETTSTAGDMSSRQTGYGLPSSVLSLSQLATSSHDSTETRLEAQSDSQQARKQNAKLLTIRGDNVSSVTKKRLTVVDEIDFQNGQALEDPFSESSSGQNSTEFEARLKSRRGMQETTAPTDPFQVEGILDSSVDAILTTPPVGCSTPRRKPRSLSRCKSPTRAPRDAPDARPDLEVSFPCAVVTQPGRRRKSPAVRNNLRTDNTSNRLGRNDGKLAGRSTSGTEFPTSLSDSTRLSSFPPGSTIRHVPRSTGRLKDAPAFSVPAAHRDTAQSLARKKHPSPSKGQLELFGRCMEKNMALGVFQDADELGMSFNSPRPELRTLSPRDTNRLMQGPALSKPDLRKDDACHETPSSLLKSRSRIPQPVRQLSRSRTDTVFARDFYPANKGDSTNEDELQWDTPAYKIGRRCGHCGSMNQII